MRYNETSKVLSQPRLEVGIPSARDADSVQELVGALDRSVSEVEFLVARFCETSWDQQTMSSLERLAPVRQILSPSPYPPSMRNAIVRGARSPHILFLDDDVEPSYDLLLHGLDLASSNPTAVFQGPPYLVANEGSWLARMEGELYERGFRRYLSSDGSVALLDARVMLAPTAVLKSQMFDESLIFGGEGRELASRLANSGIPLLLAPELEVRHRNRDRLSTLFLQKRIHGNGRGQEIERGFARSPLGTIRRVAHDIFRHFVNPLLATLTGRDPLSLTCYTLFTNSFFWFGAAEYLALKKKAR